MNPCPPASGQSGAAGHAGIVSWQEPPWRFRDLTRGLRFLMPLALLILSPSLLQAQTNDAVSREMSLFNFGQPTPSYEAVSREVSLFNFGQPTPSYEAVSREVSLFNFGQPTVGVEAISREVSLFNRGFNTYDTISREVSVFDYDFNHLSLAVGSTVVLAGTTGGVSVTFSTLVPVTNVQVAMDFPEDLLTDWKVETEPPLAGTAFVSNNSRLHLTFSTASGQSINNTLQLGQITFASASNQPSAFLPLPVAGVMAPMLQDGTTYTPYKETQNGEVVVLNSNSLLRLSLGTDGLEYLVLYGFSGTNYTIESATNLNPVIAWKPEYELTPQNFIAVAPALAMTNPAVYFRAKQ